VSDKGEKEHKEKVSQRQQKSKNVPSTFDHWLQVCEGGGGPLVDFEGIT
jgi:hypothetical protein